MNVLEPNALINPQRILNVTTDDFSAAALDVFRYQHGNCPVYRSFCDALRVDAEGVKAISDIPFLPISFFRSHVVITGNFIELPKLVFESSGTTGEQTSRHYVVSHEVYEHALLKGFEERYGATEDFVILALLPSYLERPNASLVYMAKTLMDRSKSLDNGFYINEWEALATKLTSLRAAGKKVLLLGVTFALLDFADAYPMKLDGVVVMETGGMKGRRKEMTREEVHAELINQWRVDVIHSEYGMTELLSQAYSMGQGIFEPASTMRVMVRDINDPLTVSDMGQGALNIIDLANIYSCSFIATDDIGEVYGDGSFKVRGRLDHTILRGCSQMVV
ncbi:MAG: acyl transferase [Taibaiella sp.]|nr:acyl transferase [Taibaiella sp.]